MQIPSEVGHWRLEAGRSAKSRAGAHGGDAAADFSAGSAVEEDPRIAPSELLRLAPRLTEAVPTETPTWADIVHGADRLRHFLEISKPLWGRACTTLGRHRAAVAVAMFRRSRRPAFDRAQVRISTA